jgi:hypothetical protein
MARSLWIGVLAGMLAGATASWAQTRQPERLISVKEKDKPAQKCRVLKCWRDKDGNKVCEVQALDSGERMTILEPEPVPLGTMGSRVKSPAATIFHWGASQSPPPAAPAAPTTATVLCPACSSSCAPARPTLMSRLFGSSGKSTTTEVVKSSTPPPPLASPKKTDPAATASSAQPPKVRDYRESWGKVERWTADDSKKAVAEAESRAEQVSRTNLPVAKNGGADPLKQPETYLKPSPHQEPIRPVAIPPAQPAKPPPPATQPVRAPAPPATPVPVAQALPQADTAAAHGWSWSRLWSGSSKKATPAPKPLAAVEDGPPGLGSVMASHSPHIDNDPPTPMMLVNGRLMTKQDKQTSTPGVAVSAPNAFTVMAPPQSMQGPPPGAMMGMNGGSGMAGPPPPAFQPMPSAMGNGMMAAQMSGPPPGVSNAFTRGWTTRPIPADFGTVPQMENAMTYQAQNAFVNGGIPGAAARPPLPPHPPGYFPGALVVTQQSVAYEPQTGYLIGMLRGSPLPSEREMAVEQLARYDWKPRPQLVGALLQAAQSDPAPAVRASCVRALARMKIDTPPAVQTVQALKSDSDPRVRQEVQQALAILAAR